MGRLSISESKKPDKTTFKKKNNFADLSTRLFGFLTFPVEFEVLQ